MRLCICSRLLSHSKSASCIYLNPPDEDLLQLWQLTDFTQSHGPESLAQGHFHANYWNKLHQKSILMWRWIPLWNFNQSASIPGLNFLDWLHKNEIDPFPVSSFSSAPPVSPRPPQFSGASAWWLEMEILEEKHSPITPACHPQSQMSWRWSSVDLSLLLGLLPLTSVVSFNINHSKGRKQE